MGNCSSPLRRHMRHNNTAGVLRVVQEAGEGSPDLINEDFTADCILDSCQQNMNTTLNTALSNRQLDILEILLKYGGDPNTPSRYHGQTTLHQAARQNNLVAVALLVKYGAELRSTDDDGRLAIHCAAGSLTAILHRNTAVLQYLVEEVGKSGDVNIQDASGSTPLHAAVRVEHVRAVRYLLTHGADLSITDHRGRTPLDIARPDFRRKLNRDLNI